MKDHVKVAIKKVLDGEKNTPLPVPFFGHEYLGDDIEGSWAQWPRGQIKINQEELKHPKEMNKKKDKNEKIMDLGSVIESPRKLKEDANFPPFLINKAIVLALSQSCKELYNLYKNQPIDFSIDVDFHEEIFHYPNKASFTTFVLGDDLKKFLTLGWINSPCVHIWIRFLHRKVVENNLEEVVGFFCPQRLGLAASSPKKLTSYLVHSMSIQSTKKYILAPFNENRHWMLIVLCLQRGRALFFNSLGGGLENLKVKCSLSMAYRTLKLSSGFRRCLDWTTVKCPRQPGEYECGYYVMAYMDEVLSLASTKDESDDLLQHFSLKPYSQEKIDEIRERWCRFFIDHCL